MSRIISMAFCFSLLLSSASFAKDFETTSTLTEATVYTNRAKLTREAKITLPKGDHKIIMTGLPQTMFTDSLKASGLANGKVTLGAVTYKTVTQAELIKPREKELNDQLVTLGDQKRLFQAEKTALKVQREFLKSIGQKITNKENEDLERLDLNIDSVKSASETLHTQHIENLKKGLDIDQKMRELNKQENKIRQELSQLRTGQRSTLEVSIPVEVATAGELTLSLDYQIPHASWAPIYDARLTTDKEDLDLILYGSVRQNTGEDWSDIKLTLSTAQPHRGASQPDLGPLWVNINQYARKQNFNAISANITSSIGSLEMADMAMEESIAPRELKAEKVAAPAFIQQANINTEGFISEYEIPGPSSVLADGSESKLLIGSFKTNTELHTEIKPQLSKQAYLISQSTLKGEAPILSGPVNLFRDDAYVGKSHLPMLRPGEKQNLAFGIDDSVSVTRRALKDERSEEGLIGKDSVLERHFLTEVVSLHKDPMKIVVIQNTPVSQDENISVEILKNVTTAGYEKDADKIKGLMRWTDTYAPKEQKDIKLGWKVSWPEGKQINGL